MNMPYLNLANKADHLQCSPTARHNVNEGSDSKLVRPCIVDDMGAGEEKLKLFLADVDEEDPPNMQMTASDSFENQEDSMVGPSKLIAELTKISAIGTRGMPTVFQNIREGLENSDWATHKFAADALVVLASYLGHLITDGTSQIIESLEACRFDKVKPVRDSMMEALQVWKKVSGKGDTTAPEDSMERKVAKSGNDEKLDDKQSNLNSKSSGSVKDLSLDSSPTGDKFLLKGKDSNIPENTLVSHLPGSNGTFLSKQYTRYVTIDTNHGKNLYYYFMESEWNPEKDPLVLWLNGDPGYSSFDGFIYEHSPFNFKPGGKLKVCLSCF
ncbi:hypothetical protein KFK09_027351 [Dendrobium nobile]|uniref:TORTIFOLIA1/SINE1-2 N-terminal domain-containing protein n=1 Tax=Dendrobium nobile TaxID=94219 RepID=A0A8T3AFP0_DENNO|nr:hypothetical protein KFK09_027351 [Dendrobium nobile]